MRVRKLNDRNDGGAFLPQNRPPEAHLPEAFRGTLAEYDRLLTDSYHTDNDIREMLDGWATFQLEAIRKDAAAAATAARDGSPIPISGVHVEELATRLAAAKARRDALKLAAEDVAANDLSAIRETEQANPVYTERLTKARAELRKATANLAAKAEALAHAVALHEWLYEHKPWDTTLKFNLYEVAPELRAIKLNMPSEPSTDLNHILSIIENI